MITLTQIQLRLTESIRQSGMTQTELAKALNVSQQTVSCYKSGKKCPRLTRLQIFAKFWILTQTIYFVRNKNSSGFLKKPLLFSVQFEKQINQTALLSWQEK